MQSGTIGYDQDVMLMHPCISWFSYLLQCYECSNSTFLVLEAIVVNNQRVLVIAFILF